MACIVARAALLTVPIFLAGCATLYPVLDDFRADVERWDLAGRALDEAIERVEEEGFDCRRTDASAAECRRTARTWFCGQRQTIRLRADESGRVQQVDEALRGGLRPSTC